MTTRASPDPWALHPHVLLALFLPLRLQEPLPCPRPLLQTSRGPAQSQSLCASLDLSCSSCNRFASVFPCTVWECAYLVVQTMRDPFCSGNSLGSLFYTPSLINCSTTLLGTQFLNGGKITQYSPSSPLSLVQFSAVHSRCLQPSARSIPVLASSWETASPYLLSNKSPFSPLSPGNHCCIYCF